MSQKIRFVNKDKTQFFQTLKQRVDAYFTENEITPHANTTMVVKTFVMLAVYFIPYTLIITNVATGWMIWPVFIVMGIGMAGIGMSVMHDAQHGAYSANPKINSIVGLCLHLVGGDGRNWRNQHNILHHTYTNIHDHDEDIEDKMGMRFSPNGNHRPFKRFQIFYAFFFYSLMTIYWATYKDFDQFFRYHKMGLNRDSKKERTKQFLYLIFWKAFYFGYMIVLPLLVIDMPWWQYLIGFAVMHALCGLILSLVFQLAHVVEGTQFPMPDEKGNIDNEWAIHQLNTTADFSRNSQLLTFYLGGLNYQAIHHLFPRICHVHYPAIAPIVKQTAEEFGVPYIYFPTFGEALKSHVTLLRKLGRNDIFHMMQEMG